MHNIAQLELFYKSPQELSRLTSLKVARYSFQKIKL